MAETHEVGSQSPASEEAKQQGMSGDKGAQASQTEGTQKQPAQASGRRPAEHEQAPEARKGVAPGQAPSEQGEGEPSPESIKQDQQGFRGTGTGRSGSSGAHGDRSEEIAASGEPHHGEHTRHGRQDIPADRPRE